MAESVKQICLIAHIITGKNVPKYLKQSKFNALLKKKDKKSPTRMAGQR
ncbi:peptide ABC transporter ATP-binding protein [Escherichia coli]|nr:peptide ABC transporter ATP-binding protein [Escherichia coli]